MNIHFHPEMRLVDVAKALRSIGCKLVCRNFKLSVVPRVYIDRDEAGLKYIRPAPKP